MPNKNDSIMDAWTFLQQVAREINLFYYNRSNREDDPTVSLSVVLVTPDNITAKIEVRAETFSAAVSEAYSKVLHLIKYIPDFETRLEVDA